MKLRYEVGDRSLANRSVTQHLRTGLNRGLRRGVDLVVRRHLTSSIWPLHFLSLRRDFLYYPVQKVEYAYPTKLTSQVCIFVRNKLASLGVNSASLRGYPFGLAQVRCLPMVQVVGGSSQRKGVFISQTNSPRGFSSLGPFEFLILSFSEHFLNANHQPGAGLQRIHSGPVVPLVTDISDDDHGNGTMWKCHPSTIYKVLGRIE